MKYIKQLILLFSLTLFGCNSYVTIIKANKGKYVSGLPSGKNYIDYKIKIEAKTTIEFISLKLDGNNISENLYLKDLTSGLSSTKIKSVIDAGIYEFGFRIFNFDDFDNEEKITYTYLLKGKLYENTKTIMKLNRLKANK